MSYDTVLNPASAQKILDYFKGTESIELNMKVNVRYDGPDTMLHTYESDNGKFVHILEIDYVSGLKHVNGIISRMLGRKPVFYKLKHPAKRFEDTTPYKSATVYKMPEGVDELLQYAHSGGLSWDAYFSFVFEGSAEDMVRLV